MRILLLALFSTLLPAQAATGVRPAVDLGPLAVGAVVEASFGVYWDDAGDSAFVAMATTASGGEIVEIVEIGDSLWWNTANKSPGFARLLRNLLQRAPRLR